ncbi:MAG TPA: CAP domain-containing protein [Thermoanaerobaculia bacterium]|nr:CAP domain-containing protein [Thermoanaerobaculia bacterium]
MTPSAALPGAFLLLLLLLLAGRAAGDPAAAVRDGLLAYLNQERAAAGLRPLELDARLVRVAQQGADEIARGGARAYEEAALREAFRRTRQRLERAGYEPHGWSESWALGGGGDFGRVVGGADGVLAQALDGDYTHLGVGVSDQGGVPLYTFLLAWPERDFFTRQTAGLADRDAACAAMLARVNALRAAAGAAPLALDPRLNAAAQRHAEDMLARSFYAHESPEGTGPRERVRAAGYPPAALVGENIARGALSVEEALAGWNRSRPHRRNLLHRSYEHLGVGFAAGRGAEGWTVVWVQDFARPAP